VFLLQHLIGEARAIGKVKGMTLEAIRVELCRQCNGEGEVGQAPPGAALRSTRRA
jgi:hypothetical protein